MTSSRSARRSSPTTNCADLSGLHGILAQPLGVLAQHVELARERVEATLGREVPAVGVLRRQPEAYPLALRAQPDGGPPAVKGGGSKSTSVRRIGCR